MALKSTPKSAKLSYHQWNTKLSFCFLPTLTLQLNHSYLDCAVYTDKVLPGESHNTCWLLDTIMIWRSSFNYPAAVCISELHKCLIFGPLVMAMGFSVTVGAFKCDCFVSDGEWIRRMEKIEVREWLPLASLPSNLFYVTPGWHTNNGNMT